MVVVETTGSGVARTNGEHEFTTLASEDVYVGRILALRADEVGMPGGGHARREVVEHYGAVAIAAIDEHDRVVLVRQYRYPIGRRLWELPAGLLDVAGEPPVRTAQRELAEEAGLAAEDWSVLVDVASSPGFTDEVVRVFLATGLSEVTRPDAVGDEEADLVIERFPLAEAVRMALAGEIVNGPAVAGLLAAQAARDGVAQTRPADAEWIDRPLRFAAR
ncbi:NUDIX hydrolase [Saccharopolyspora aridisoli]|uniref:NUDIX hydrolase n=1 Tax=Saccharopolyspora aridisoli TaxID=2530385 RepID=A0A4R4UGU8_9PSEU|nr:NUDIX hydrolase [Saccharopolyspora aridisoli]TDC87473.1 NUDIX hydrolase [Saccharopolyspora aridisoli]